MDREDVIHSRGRRDKNVGWGSNNHSQVHWISNIIEKSLHDAHILYIIQPLFIYAAFFLILKPKNEEYIVLIMNYLPMGVEVVPKSFCKQLLGLIWAMRPKDMEHLFLEQTLPACHGSRLVLVSRSAWARSSLLPQTSPSQTLKSGQGIINFNKDKG